VVIQAIESKILEQAMLLGFFRLSKERIEAFSELAYGACD
jgi:hypothetical protein